VRVNACLNTVKIEWLNMVCKGFVNSDRIQISLSGYVEVEGIVI